MLSARKEPAKDQAGIVRALLLKPYDGKQCLPWKMKYWLTFAILQLVLRVWCLAAVLLFNQIALKCRTTTTFAGYADHAVLSEGLALFDTRTISQGGKAPGILSSVCP